MAAACVRSLLLTNRTKARQRREARKGKLRTQAEQNPGRRHIVIMTDDAEDPASAQALRLEALGLRPEAQDPELRKLKPKASSSATTDRSRCRLVGRSPKLVEPVL